MGKNSKKQFGKDFNEINYEKYVPIIEVDLPAGKLYKIYITKMITEPSKYDEMCTVLSSCNDGDKVEVHLTTPGGYLDSANRIVSHLTSTNAETLAVLSGCVASAGTLITLACDNAVMTPYSTFMIHNYSGGAYGKGHELEADINHMQKIYKEMTADSYQHFLSKKEIKTVIKGGDYYFDMDEFNTRWDKVLKAREVELAGYQAEYRDAELEMLKTTLDEAGYIVTPKAKKKKTKK